jgi:cyclase
MIVVTHHNNIILDMEPLQLAQTYENLGVGEIVFSSVNRDGCKTGYDVDFLKNARKKLNIPITALGGCASLSDVAILTNEVGLIGSAASTIFLYKGRHDAVLIQYPDEKQKNIATEL